MREQDLTRRSVLHGAAVLGAATLLVSQHSTPTVGMAEGSAPWGPGTVGKTGPGSAGGQSGATARGLSGLVGATVSPTAMRTRLWIEAARKFDAIVHRPMAVTACRLYFHGATIDRDGLYLVRMMAATGVSMVLSIRPSRNLSRSETTTLQRTIRQCRAAGLKTDGVPQGAAIRRLCAVLRARRDRDGHPALLHPGGADHRRRSAERLLPRDHLARAATRLPRLSQLLLREPVHTRRADGRDGQAGGQIRPAARARRVRPDQLLDPAQQPRLRGLYALPPRDLCGAPGQAFVHVLGRRPAQRSQRFGKRRTGCLLRRTDLTA